MLYGNNLLIAVEFCYVYQLGVCDSEPAEQSVWKYSPCN